MAKLIKNVSTTYIPGDPGNPGSPYIPPQRARTVTEEQTTCSISWAADPVVTSSGSGTSVSFGTPGAVVCTAEDVLVYYPATAAVAGVPYAPPTAAQTVISLNQGWNSYARTVGQLLPGTYIESTVKYGSHAVLLAVGRAGMEGAALSDFPYGIMIDTAAIYSFESGSAAALASANTPGLPIRIARLADGRIAYSVGGEAARISEVDTYAVYDELYVYGLLYSGNDEATTSVFKTGELVADIGATLRGAGELTVRMSPRATLEGSGELLAAFDTAVTLNGYGTLTVALNRASTIDATLTGGGSLLATLDTGGRGTFALAALQFLASDSASEFSGYGYAELPLFTAAGSEAVFVPAQPTAGYFNLPFHTVWGDGIDIDLGVGAMSLPEYRFIASEGEYGIGSFSLPLFYAGGYGGFMDDDEIILFSTGLARSQQANAIDLVMVLNSSGELTSSLSMTREQVLALLSVLQHSSSFSMLGIYGMSMLSSLHGLSLETLSVGTSADLYDDGAVWVVNLDTNASVQYEQYGFNSFFQRGNDYYGVANDGIYKLSGDTDNGSPINALVEFAKSNFGVPQDKTMPNVYLAAASDGALVLKVVTGTNTLFYTARSSSTELDKHRVDLGRGLQGMYWQFSVMNQNGDDFNVAGMEFLPIASKRRI